MHIPLDPESLSPELASKASKYLNGLYRTEIMDDVFTGCRFLCCLLLCKSLCHPKIIPLLFFFSLFDHAVFHYRKVSNHPSLRHRNVYTSFHCCSCWRSCRIPFINVLVQLCINICIIQTKQKKPHQIYKSFQKG